MAVAQLYYHAGLGKFYIVLYFYIILTFVNYLILLISASEMPLAAKALVRLLKGPIEVQSIVLHSIASLTISNKVYFFIRTML